LHTPLADTRALFAAAAEPKQLWLIPDAAHVDLYAHTPQTYRETVLTFLQRHLAD
jgi:uncharacterized protein